MGVRSFSKVVVAGPFKSEAAMAKKLGVSQQYVNRKIRKNERVFHLDGEKVIASRETKFVASGTNITATSKEGLALKLGVSQDAVAKVLRKKTSGFVQTPKGEVKIQRLKPGEKPILPAVRVLWNDDTEKQDFFSFAAAGKELKIDPKTIPTALKAGRNSFIRKSDGKKFTIEIPDESTPTRHKPRLSEEEKAKRAEAKRRIMIAEAFSLHCPAWDPKTPIEEKEEVLNNMKAWEEQRAQKNRPLQEKEKSFEEKKDGGKDTVEPPKQLQEKSPEPPVELPESLVELETKPEEEDSDSAAEQLNEEASDSTEEQINEEDSDSAEKQFNEKDLVYLGMGLWEKKKPEEEEEEEDEDPFHDELYTKLFPTLGTTYDTAFLKAKKTLLKPGETVFRLVDETDKVSRVLVVDCDFQLLETYPPEDFEDSFWLSSVYPSNCVDLNEYSDVGIIPLGKVFGEMIWRIKVCEKENKN